MFILLFSKKQKWKDSFLYCKDDDNNGIEKILLV